MRHFRLRRPVVKSNRRFQLEFAVTLLSEH